MLPEHTIHESVPLHLPSHAHSTSMSDLTLTHPPVRHLLGLSCAALMCLMSGCLTTLDLSEEFPVPDMPPSSRPDMQRPDMPIAPDAQGDLDVRPDLAGDTPQDMPGVDMPGMDMPGDMRPDLPPDMPAAMPGTGLIISEVVEGSSNDKAVEIYNSSSRDVPLKDIYLVLLSHTMIDIEGGKEVALDSSGMTSLPSGEVLVLCHKMITQDSACDILDSTVINFNGDDRLGIFYDSDNSAAMETDFRAIKAGDPLIDSFGHIMDDPPDDVIWAEASFQRCNFAPYLSNMAFDVTMYFSKNTASLDDLGTPPLMATCMP